MRRPESLGTGPLTAVEESESAPRSFTAQELDDNLNQIVSSEETESLVRVWVISHA